MGAHLRLLNFSVLDQAWKNALPRASLPDKGFMSGVGIGLSSAVMIASAVGDGDWGQAVTAAATGIVGIVGIANPLLGLIGGLVLSFFPGPATQGPDWGAFRDMILNETKTMISENSAQEMINRAGQTSTATADFLHANFNRNFDNKSDIEKKGTWVRLSDQMTRDFGDLFGGQIGCYDTSNPDNGLSNISNSKQCQRFFASGVFLQQVTWVGLHLHAFAMQATFAGEEQGSAENFKAWGHRYLRLTNESLYAWARYAPDSVACKYADWSYANSKRMIDNSSNLFTLTGELISDTMGCSPQITLPTDCVQGVWSGNPPNQEMRYNGGPEVCKWQTDNDFCSPTATQDVDTSCGDIGRGPWGPPGIKGCTYRAPTNSVARCSHSDFYNFKAIFAGRAHGLYDPQIKQLKDLLDNFHTCADTGQDVNTPNYYKTPTPVPCCNSDDEAKHGSTVAVRCLPTDPDIGR